MVSQLNCLQLVSHRIKFVYRKTIKWFLDSLSRRFFNVVVVLLSSHCLSATRMLLLKRLQA